ncbi:MAG: molybdopterin converting factor subunit 1 [Candidatus Tectomicrobia bacterium]|uniref:Molybdopterin synthase sulfur carrier subunit n=1 Tax=Tectimicrobiota bacterium TaxID=2528274 RepID=A0A932GMR5_UNCTE|nr:molybdopterin converting factor subunit 1 [Candidatus Tectomicrobia bacterium]
MQVRLKLFAILREKLGEGEISMEMQPGSKVEDLLATLASRQPEIAPLLPNCLIAVNRQYVPRSQVLTAGDEIAVIPPVSGGK